MLIELRKLLQGSYERARDASAEEFGTDVPDVNDEATRTINRRIMLEIGDKNFALMTRIDEALERIEEGGYGVCAECEEDIPEPRLELLPYAQYCVKCQDRIERE